MVWVLLIGWLVVALVVSTVCGRVLRASQSPGAPVDPAPLVAMPAPRVPFSTH